MKATIYHNPRCGTSRKTLGILDENGADVTIIDYLAHPPTAEELARLYQRAGMSARDGLRAKEDLAEDLNVRDREIPDHELLEIMVANPILINRPLVETDKGVRLCRPQEKVLEIL